MLGTLSIQYGYVIAFHDPHTESRSKNLAKSAKSVVSESMIIVTWMPPSQPMRCKLTRPKKTPRLRGAKSFC